MKSGYAFAYITTFARMKLEDGADHGQVRAADPATTESGRLRRGKRRRNEKNMRADEWEDVREKRQEASEEMSGRRQQNILKCPAAAEKVVV